MQIRTLIVNKRYRVIGDRGLPYIVRFFISGEAECSCPHFQERLKWRPLGRERQCKHIDAVIDYCYQKQAEAQAEAKKRPTEEMAAAALEVLVAYGRAAHTSKVSRGVAIGNAVFSLDMPTHPPEEGISACTEVVVDAAMEMLEQWNGHLSVACIAAIEKDHGKVERKGNVVTITLPEYWKKI